MAEGVRNPPDLETQKNEICTLIKKPLRKADTWYLVDNKWFKQWRKYVGYDSWDTSNIGENTIHPGPIDNSSLFREENSPEIKDHLIDELDYILVPKEAWELLVSWYGICDGQEPIARKVVEYGMFVKHCKVEVYLVEFKLCQNNDTDNCVTKKFSKVDTIEHIEQEMRKIFKIPADKETRLWNKYSVNTYEHLNNKESTVQDAGLYQGQVIIIEQRNDDGTWPRQVKSTSSVNYNSSTQVLGDSRPYSNQTSTMTTRSYVSMGGGYGGSSYNYEYHNGSATTVQSGLCGLSNLGNTCFMNSALQCMSNTPPLTDYFLQDYYWKEMNTENPLGMHGEIAKSYGDLIKTMWSGRYTYILPRNFKTIVGRFAPQFSGYQQQDCQELMAFLLDGLHEDLNRVKKKPYIELRDADGRPDEIVAKEAWENYLKRNNSIIVDTFHGLLKSTLVCPECSKISVTFDPFCYLSLPLPIKKERQIEVSYVPLDDAKRPIQMKLTVPKMGIVQDLCDAIGKTMDVSSDKLLVADVYNCRFHKIYQSEENLSNILDRDEIYVYELPVAGRNDSNILILPVYMRERSRLRPGTNNFSTSSHQLFGQPLLVPVPRNGCTYNILFQSIINKMSRYVKELDTDDEWWNEPNDPDRLNGEIEMANIDEYDSDVQDDDADERENIHMSEGNIPPLFTLSSVNAYGNVEVEKIKDDESILQLSNKTYIAVDWHPKAKEKFYDEKEAKEHDIHESLNVRWSQKKQVIQLSECLELFTTTEKLGAEDPWYCPECKKHQQATKKFDLWSLPQVLIIHLKRFSYNRYWRDKIDTLVEFPVSGLNMAKYIINPHHNPAVYDLIAVANHYGGMGGGHYTAYAKNKQDGLWYYFDDSTVSSATEDNTVSKAAYVLFYMRRDSDNTQRNVIPRRNIPAALGAPPGSDLVSPDDNDGTSHSSEEDVNMDIN
ncbi:ubiquitin carboxyl-terminal hydrolase 15-like isoform X2 [Centruroides vittatus]|uniref:ubiquitin carboxyl-terminal hydrolase 15-like isoform X2 n=1 Tax=Centruroides vittatus TaxID=120091 RepID=UPI00350FEC50